MKTLITLALAFLLPLQAFAAKIVSPQAGIQINTNKIIHIEGPIDEALAYRVMAEGKATQELWGDRVVIINSPGGSVDAGNVILRALIAERNATGNRLICVVDHNAHSMAFNILSYCDVRLAVSGSQMLVHKVAVGGLDDGRTRWTARNLRRQAEELDRADEPFRRRNALMMHMDIKDYDILSEMETMCSTQSLLNRGYLDGVAVILP